jgi:hypothetical protein
MYNCNNKLHIIRIMAHHEEKEEQIHGEIHLPYYKQGDDMNRAIEKSDDGKVRVKASLLNHIELLTNAITQLREIHDNIKDDSQMSIDGDTHMITISGPNSVMQPLIEQKLVDKFDSDGEDGSEEESGHESDNGDGKSEGKKQSDGEEESEEDDE